jgi:putative MFS transporter
MHVTAAQAAGYFVYVSAVGIAGRIIFSIVPARIGRRLSGQLVGYGMAVTLGAAAIFHGHYIAGMSVFVIMLIVDALFNDGGFSTLTPYTAEIFPVRLGARGIGLAQAANGLGKITGPYCLALIAGTDKLVSVKATEAAILPTFLFLAACGLVIGVCFSFFAPETVGRPLALDE